MKPRSMTLALVCLLGASAAAQQPAAPGRGRGPQPVDPRIQIRMHHFAEMNEDIPYALSVPMKTCEYIEVPGGDHGTVIGSHQAEIFAFFAKHSR